MSTSMVDFRWMSKGGLLLDSTGDISFTGSSWECMAAMINSRLQAAVNGWKLYPIGAGLESNLGTDPAEAEISIQRQAITCLSQDFLPTGAFTVSTLRLSDTETAVFVYVQNQLVATTTVST
jgi:hypothetical protein